MPNAKTVNAKRPAIGRNASAAWEEVWMSVTPWVFRDRRKSPRAKSPTRGERARNRRCVSAHQH
jgi:hypothetical protein